MTRRMSGTRASALRRAQEAKARRDAEHLERERRVESALADFFEGKGAATDLRAEARRKAERLVADAETASAVPEESARKAVVALRELGETQPQIAELTGLTTSEVRAALAAGDSSAGNERSSRAVGFAGRGSDPDRSSWSTQHRAR